MNSQPVLVTPSGLQRVGTKIRFAQRASAIAMALRFRSMYRIHKSGSLLRVLNRQWSHVQLGGIRHYIPITPEEEAEEKDRVASLSDFQKDQELRKYNRDIARLEALKGINTGERYSWSGRYKSLARDYGMPLVAWYWACWGVTFAGCFGAITLGGIDPMPLVAKADSLTGWDLTARVDPELGKIGLAILVNEVLEPIRLPIVIVTVKPVMDQIFPPKF